MVAKDVNLPWKPPCMVVDAFHGIGCKYPFRSPGHLEAVSNIFVCFFRQKRINIIIQGNSLSQGTVFRTGQVLP